MDISGSGPITSTRMERPLTVSSVVSFPGGLGVDVGYQVHDRVQLSAQASSMLIFSQASAGVRLFPVTSERAGLYVGVSGTALASPLITWNTNGQRDGVVGVTGVVGAEFRARNGFTLAGEVGALAVGKTAALTAPVIPEAQIRLGYAF